MNVRVACLGMTEGNFRGTPGDEEIRRKILRSPGYPQITSVLRTRCNMTTAIGNSDDPHLWTETSQKGVWMPRSDIDGIVTYEMGMGIAIANADCPVIRLWNNTEGWQAILHGALRCLVPEDGKSPGILQVFCGMHKLTSRTYADIGFGIGPCCYGLERPPECTENALMGEWPGDPTATATKGPRAGWQAFDLRRIARAQLVALGFTPDNIHDNHKTLPCTACATDLDGNFLYHSNARSEGQAGRNLVIAWREKSVCEK